MLFDPELFDPPLFEDAPAFSVPPAPIFRVNRDDAGTPYSFTAPFKDPNSVEVHGMDWSDWLQEGDGISTQEVFADSDALIIDQVSEAAGVVSWRVQGGLDDGDYIVTCRITTNSGLLDDRSIRVPVRQR